MPFRQFIYLSETVKTRSINQAAKNLYISPQALRAAIGSIEDKLGFKVFVRTRQGLSLTEEGEQIRQDLDAILDIGRRWASFAEEARLADTTVRMVASTALCNNAVPKIMSLCRIRHPEIRLQQYEARDDGLLRMLAEQRMIGVVAAAPYGEFTGQYTKFAGEHGYYLELLREDRFCVYINTKSPLAEKEELELSDLAGLTLAVYPSEVRRMYYRRLFSYFAPTPPLQLMHQESIFQLVADNGDVACLFPAIAGERDRNLREGLIRPMTVKDFPMPAAACMLYPPASTLTPAEKQVVDLIRETVCGQG